MIYNPESLKSIEHHIAKAIDLMNDHINKNKLRDGGTCVMGEGIDINFIPKGKRKPVRMQIVSQPFQGNNRPALIVAQKHLEAQGIKVYYNPGRMD